MDGGKMEFKQIESFIEVVNASSFSRAAEKMYLTQPTLTNHIQTLEEELGTQLFNRSNKKIKLTISGSKFYAHALNLVNLRDKVKVDMNDQVELIDGSLQISTSSIPGQYILPYIISDFIACHSKVKFNINHKNSTKVIEEIEAGYVNYGFVGDKLHNNECLEYIDFYEDKLVIITPLNNKYSEIDVLTMDTFLSEKIIIREEGSSTRKYFENALNKNGIDINDLNILSCIEDNETIKKLVELGAGISIMSELAVKKEIELGLIKSFSIEELELKRKFYYVYHKKRYFTLLDNEFKKFIENMLCENQIM